MKSILLTLLLSALGLAAQDRYVTVTLPEKFEIIRGDKYDVISTNTLEIAQGETGHLMCLIRGARHAEVSIYVEKNGVVGTVLPVYGSTSAGTVTIHSPPDSIVVNGPAKLLVAGYEGSMATFKITPDLYPPDRTVVVPGGPGGATVTMECSTNLVHWDAAVGGTYTNLPGVKFFRIKLDRIQP